MCLSIRRGAACCALRRPLVCHISKSSADQHTYVAVFSDPRETVPKSSRAIVGCRQGRRRYLRIAAGGGAGLEAARLDYGAEDFAAADYVGAGAGFDVEG